MDIEEFLKNKEYEEKGGNLYKALNIAEREWNKVRLSLSLCGDIGEYSNEDFMIGIIEDDVIIKHPLVSPTKSVSFYSPTFYPMYFVDNLVLMDEKCSKAGYKSIEALYVFIELATKAIERLGVYGNLAMAFGSGYGNVRTGWIDEKSFPEERKIFQQIFFKGKKVDYNWDFHWNSVQLSFKELYDKFITWQNNPEIHKKEASSKAIVKRMMV